MDRSMRLSKPHGLFVSTAVLPEPAVPLPLGPRRLVMDPLGVDFVRVGDAVERIVETLGLPTEILEPE